MRLIELSDAALADLEEICTFLGRSLAGEEFVAALVRQRENLKRFSNLGRTEYPLASNKRVLGLTRGYMLSYETYVDQTGDERVVIRRIFHGARRPGTLD